MWKTIGGAPAGTKVPNALRPQHAVRKRQSNYSGTLVFVGFGTRQTWYSSIDEKKCLSTQHLLSTHRTCWNFRKRKRFINHRWLATPRNELTTSTEYRGTTVLANSEHLQKNGRSPGKTKKSPPVSPMVSQRDPGAMCTGGDCMARREGSERDGAGREGPGGISPRKV